MEGRSPKTSEAACRNSTATATAIGAAAGARTISPAASATRGRSRLPGERTAPSIALVSAGARLAGGGSARESSRSSRGRQRAAKPSKAGVRIAAGSVCRDLGEARHRLRLRLVDVEHGDELRDCQHVVDLRGQMEELQFPALVRDRRVAPDKLAD